MNKLIVSLLLVFPFIGYTQTVKTPVQRRYESIKIDSISPDFTKIKTQADKHSAVILQDLKVVEYIFEKSNNSDVLFRYETDYKKVLVNGEKGIDYFNRVYIPAGKIEEIIQIEVLSITPGGKRVALNKNNIKEVENLDNKGAYKIFAVEGIEQGCIVEILYTIKKSFSEYGVYSYHDKFPTYNAQYELHTPNHLKFNIKSYNGNFSRKDTTINTQNIVTFTADSLKVFREEEYSAWKTNVPRILYQFSHNTDKNKDDVNLWANAVKGMYGFFSKEQSEDAKIKKIVKSLKIDKLSETEKIKVIENYIKNNFEAQELQGVDNLMSLEFILKNKFTNKDGMTLLFSKMLTAANIVHYIGFSTDRFSTKFDPDFFTWLNLDEYVIYFPDSDHYLSPATREYRLDMLPIEICNNNALFMKPIKIGDFNTVLPEFKFIRNMPMEKSYTLQTASISFNEDKSVALVNYKHELAGYESSYIKPYYDYIPEENREKVITEMIKFMGDDTKVIEFKVTNTNHDLSCFDEVFTIDSKLEVASLIENAGENFIFNLGDVIGEQVEMYNDHERDNPMELRHVHYYKRHIEVEIPQGYTVTGMESIKINKEYGNDKEKTMGFISDYKIEGNKLIVDVYEYYKAIEYPLEQYEEFRSVINAAADFNKISVVFEKL